jgi:hypothetical protein
LVNDEEAEAAELEERLHQADLERRRLALRNKVQSVSRMLSMFKQLREEREAVRVFFFLRDFFSGFFRIFFGLCFFIPDLERRRMALRNKVQFVSRMLSMFKQLREEREVARDFFFSDSDARIFGF